MILSDVMDEIGGRLNEIPGLVVIPFTATRISLLPSALISLPPNGTYDQTYGRGMDTLRLEIFVLVSKNVDLPSRDAISPFVSGSGPSSIRAALATKGWQSCDAVKVTGFNSVRIVMSDNKYLGAVFPADVYGRGA